MAVLSLMRKLELIKAHRMEQENPHIAAHKKAFPQTRLTAYQLDMIEGTVKDEQAWASTIRFWAGNQFRGESVWKMLQYYEEQVMKNGNTDYARPAYDCEECFDTGEITTEDPNSITRLKFAPCPKCRSAA